MAGFACTLYWGRFMDRTALTKVPDALVTMNIFIAGFTPLIGLTGFLVSARVIWPPTTPEPPSVGQAEEQAKE
jgi:hypothetical protein